MIQSKNSVSSDFMPDETLAQIVQELIHEFQEGKTCRFEECVKRYPEYEDRLRQMFPAIEGLIDLGVSHAGGSKSPSIPFDSLQGELGDFRLIREIGRGGMGVVYEAEQVSLGRRVALKVLPFAGMLDPRQLQRFQNEARAAAGLHHPNIVPVHSVGCDRGVHYYAMQYIEGRTLAEVIDELRHQADPKANADAAPLAQAAGKLVSEDPLPGSKYQAEYESTVLFNPNAVPPTPSTQNPAFLPEAAATKPVASNSTEQPARSKPNLIRSKAYCRNVAQLGIQIAEALDYAHSLGITHRDIKPSNLLLDDRGTVWVADFGLAQVGTEGNLTLTGEMLGTLRYMSPEQASGQKGLLDQRTDIYSLGITLYELLTLEPAFPGTDRKELLHQVLNKEPVSPRQHNPAIPRDLETVILKAIAKEPGSRYATAQELAQDLKRYIADQPIRAKRPGLVERGAKWSLRHRKAVMAAVMLFIIISATANGVAVAWAEREHSSALRERAARTEAEENLALAKEAVDQYLNVVTEDPQLKQANFHQLRKRLLESALPFYERFVQLKTDDPQMQVSRGLAFERLGLIQLLTWNQDAALGYFQQMHAAFTDLANRHPERAEYQTNLANSYRRLAQTYLTLEKPAEAIKAYEQSIEIHWAWEDDHRLEPEFQHGLVSSYQGKGVALAEVGKWEEAKTALEECVRVGSLAVKHFPEVEKYQNTLAASTANLALVLRKLDEVDAARTALENAVQIRKALVQHDPQQPEYRRALAVALNSLGIMLQGMEEPEVVRAHFDESIAISRDLVKKIPEIPEYKDTLMMVLNNLGILLEQQGDLDEAQSVKEEWEAVAQSLANRQLGIPRLEDPNKLFNALPKDDLSKLRGREPVD